MAVSHYFRNFSPTVTAEQDLMESLIGESIRVYGHDVRYIPRESFDEIDKLFGEDVLSKFTKAYTVEMFIANVEGYEGDGDFFSKFGLEIRDNSNFVVAKRAFDKYVPTSLRPRPREGDLIYVPVLRKLFEIKFVEEELLFFSLGKRNPFMYELRCELFRYSNESINTGIEEVDIIEDESSYSITVTLGTGSGNYIIGETIFQGANTATSTFSAKLADWNPTAKILTLINTKGSVLAAVNMIGASSNTRYLATISDEIEAASPTDIYDNRLIQTEANTFIDITTDPSPFGSP